MTQPEPVFEAPWHAEVFAITVALNEAGAFGWPEWTEAFGATLNQMGLARSLDGGDDYFSAWVETLERLLAEKGLAASDALETQVAAWRQAYLETPHGEPVRL